MSCPLKLNSCSHFLSATLPWHENSISLNKDTATIEELLYREFLGTVFLENFGFEAAVKVGDEFLKPSRVIEAIGFRRRTKNLSWDTRFCKGFQNLISEVQVATRQPDGDLGLNRRLKNLESCFRFGCFLKDLLVLNIRLEKKYEGEDVNILSNLGDLFASLDVLDLQ